MAWYSANSGNAVHAVKTTTPNAWGLYDMHGNLWEWVNDNYSATYYTSAAVTDPAGPTSGSDRVNRGGAFGYSASYVRSADRNSSSPSGRFIGLGARLCANP